MFAAIASGNPLQLSSDVPNSNGMQHTIVLSSTKPKTYSHITLFILPNVAFPDNYIATVYFKLTPTDDFQLFGYLNNEKPSAIFKVKMPKAGYSDSTNNDDLGEIDMDDDDGSTVPMSDINNNLSEVLVGISIEPKEMGMETLANWKAQKAEAASTINNQSLVVSRNVPTIMNINTPGQLAKYYPRLTQEMAGKIVQHAYNYLSGFLDEAGNVPIKKFDGWWDKFKNRLANDGSFIDEITKE